MDPTKRLWFFWTNHKWKFIIGSILIALILLTWWGMSRLESFYRDLTLAQLPLQILLGGLHAAIFVFMYSTFMMGRGFTSVGKNEVKGSQVNVKFSDVIGIDEAKEEAWEVVQLIKDHAKLKRIGGKILRGIIMLGPPGCGKTYLAKAVATEAGMPFVSMAASEFIEMFVGVGASRMRKLFKQARNLAYGFGGCIVFIDELDAIGQNRSFNQFGGQEHNSTLNQLLTEMDGLGKSSADNVIIIAATNAPENSLDQALMRPGRFDRKIYVTAPGLEGRENLFKYYLSKVKHEAAIDVSVLARKAVGKSPAQIENLVKEAALIATRNDKDAISWKEVSEAIERIDLGVKQRFKMTDREKYMTAYHETGHLIVTYLLHPRDDVFKASIIPRKSSLGVVHRQPREDIHSEDRNVILANIKTAVAGFVAEKIKFGTTTTGVSGDFDAAMRYAHMMVWRVGMGPSGLVGDFTAIPKEQLSDSMKTRLNEETEKILAECIDDVDKLLRKEMAIMDRFAHELMVREELEFDEIEAIFTEYGKPNPRIAEEGHFSLPSDMRAAIDKREKNAEKEGSKSGNGSVNKSKDPSEEKHS